MNRRIDIDYWVESKAVSAVRRFYPSIVAKELSIPINIVFDKLIDMVRDGKLELYWEVICPDCHRACSISLSQNTGLHQDYECIEGHCFTVTIDDIVPSFEITDYYRSRVRDNKKKESQRQLVPV